MDRRIIGAFLLALGLIAAILIPSVHPAPLAGYPQAIPVAAMPKVGDCLLADPPRAAAGGRTSAPAPLGASFGTCGGEHYGEVYSVGSAIADVPASCTGFAQFLGPAATGKPWQRFYSGTMITLTPNSRQTASGQHWTACLVTPPSLNGYSQQYTGTLRGALARGTEPVVYAYCSPLAVPEPRAPTTCTQPHTSELLRIDYITTDTTQAALDASCAAFATAVTRMPDVTAGGLLIPHAYVNRVDIYGDVSHTPGTVGPGVQESAVCMLSATGNRQLTGTLVGIGDVPVIWAS